MKEGEVFHHLPAIIVPKVEYRFLEDLIRILGSPNSVNVNAWNNQYKIDKIRIKEGYSEHSCVADNLEVIDIYRDKHKKIQFSSALWHQYICEGKFMRLLNAEFTPYNFKLEINRKFLPEKYKLLVDIIDKYGVPHNITLLREDKMLPVKIKTT